MYSKYFNDRLKKLVIMDKYRFHKLGKLIQNSFFYVIFTFIIGLIVNDIFPPFDNLKNKSKILIEVILQILLLSIFIFYLRKVVLLFPYLFEKNIDTSKFNDDLSSQYSEIVIILIIIISTQGQLFKKINYLFLHINNKSTEYDLNLLNNNQDKNNDQKIIKYHKDNNIKINVQNKVQDNIQDKQKQHLNEDNNEIKLTPLNITKYNSIKKDNNIEKGNNLQIDNSQKIENIEKGSMQNFLHNLQNNISALESPTNLHYSSYYLPSQDTTKLTENYRDYKNMELRAINNQINDQQSNFNNVEELFNQQNQQMNDKIENFSNNINRSNDLIYQNNFNSKKNINSSYVVPTSSTLQKKMIDDYFPRNNKDNYSTSIKDIKSIDNQDINNNNPIKIPDYNSLINDAYQKKI